MTKQNILTVEIDVETFEQVAPPLLRRLFEVDRIPSAKGALELVSAVPFSAVVVRYPLQGMSFDDFLMAVRHPESASQQSKIALLAENGHEQEANAYLGEQASLVLRINDDAKQHEERLCAMLGIQPRQDSRVLVKLQVAMGDSKHDRFIAQTKDISVSGMFVITKKRHPIGQAAAFEFDPPGDSKPIRGVAEVTRHSEAHDRVSGMGFKFVSFTDDGKDRLAKIVTKT